MCAGHRLYGAQCPKTRKMSTKAGLHRRNADEVKGTRRKGPKVQDGSAGRRLHQLARPPPAPSSRAPSPGLTCMA